ncbi:prepilin-type N-terminal cleavage/methylation domain-containing protein [Chitinimonas sp.]|uniref:type IV pilus modification PilV family protein n=1 Tax=Chitinimonas sp. TaxID=1934313 RepID=UPI0035B127A9
MRIDRQRRPQQAGFTLIEVLVALVILGIGIASILSAYSGSLRLMQRARDHASAGLLARSKLDETLATENAEISDDGREERYNGTLFGYRITTTPVDLVSKSLAEKLPGAPRLEEVKVEVFWGEEGQQQRYVMSSYRNALSKPDKPK